MRYKAKNPYILVSSQIMNSVWRSETIYLKYIKIYFSVNQYQIDPNSARMKYLNAVEGQIIDRLYLQHLCYLLASGQIYSNPQLWNLHVSLL